MEHSIFAAQLWDLRASLERQVRSLTSVQQAQGAFHRSADRHERDEIKGHVIPVLNDVRALTEAVRRMLDDALRQADDELRA
jgi:hypothetical protein